MRRLLIRVGTIEVDCELFDTPTADALWNAAPFKARANTWGDEVYFSTPVSCKAESNAKTVMELGELAFWLAGDSIAIGWGPTPVSRGDEIRLASPANVWGKALTDVRLLRNARPGAAIEVLRAE